MSTGAHHYRQAEFFLEVAKQQYRAINAETLDEAGAAMLFHVITPMISFAQIHMGLAGVAASTENIRRNGALSNEEGSALSTEERLAEWRTALSKHEPAEEEAS